jgi:hypothetical protein
MKPYRVPGTSIMPNRILAPALASGAVLFAIACDGAPAPARDAEGISSSRMDSLQTRLSEAGLYRVALRPEDGQVPLGRMHGWVVHLATRDGETFVPSRLAVTGGMPQHGHGFETTPRATRSLGGGDFLVEGVKFHMPGDWTIRIDLVGPAGPDVAEFVIAVGP